jgi:hypothetical protein
MRTLTEIGREVYGHDRRAINKHSERTYEDERGLRYVLSRTLDGCPPFYEAYGPFNREHEGVLPSLKVKGREYWGSGWDWARAIRAFCAELQATVVAKRR